MDGPGLEARSQTPELRLPGAKHDLMSSRIVGHHADDDVAIEQSGEVVRGLHAERLKHRCGPGCVQIAGHLKATRNEIGRHGAAHMAKADEAYASFEGL